MGVNIAGVRDFNFIFKIEQMGGGGGVQDPDRNADDRQGAIEEPALALTAYGIKKALPEQPAADEENPRQHNGME